MVVLIDTDAKQETVIVNNTDELSKFHQAHKSEIWVGYNSNGYDRYIQKAILCGFDPKEVNDFIIVKKKKGWEFSKALNRIQLINYDAQTKRSISLKQLEAFMGHDIRETTVPFDIDRKLTQSELDEVIHYCRHDVSETMEVFRRQLNEFDAQLSLLREFDLPLRNISKTQAQLSATILGAVPLAEPDKDRFEISLPETMIIEKYTNVVKFFRGYNSYDMTLQTSISEVPHTFAGGGVHGAHRQYQFECGPDEYMIMADVDQLYPSIMIKYNLLSRAVRQPEKFKNILDTSLRLKAEGNKKAREPYKRICNITYGSEGDQYNAMFDPRNRLLVCIYGQLLLLDLIEKLEHIPSYRLIQSNTDGILVRIKKEDFKWFDDVVYEWENRTGLHMSFDFYKKIFQKDVNNYIIIDHKGGFKSKGAYAKKQSDLDYDLPIVNEAVVKYFTDGVPVQKTINGCQEFIKFQKVVKISGKYSYAIYGMKKKTERVFRLFASKHGKQLMKVKNNVPERISYTPDVCQIVNEDVNEMSIPDWLDRSWYIEMATKRINDYLGR